MVDVRDTNAPLHSETTLAIRMLNDLFRTQGYGNGTCIMTKGVQAMGEDFVHAAFKAVKSFNNFTPDNDPWGEHDCALFEVNGEKLLYKIDYYDPSRRYGSENPANEKQTHRVLTIMLASEY